MSVLPEGTLSHEKLHAVRHRRRKRRAAAASAILIVALPLGCSFLFDVDNLSGGGRDEAPSAVMPPTFIGLTALTPPKVSQWVLQRPTGVDVGDLLIAVLYVDATPHSIEVPPGWTKQNLPLCDSVAVWAYHIVSDSEDMRYTFTVTDPYLPHAAVLIGYHGVDPSNPIDDWRLTDNVGRTRTYTAFEVRSNASTKCS